VLSTQLAGVESTGKIVIKDAHVAVFTDVLGRFVIDPAAFTDEKVTIGPDCNGRLLDE
jgi:hypothetical protein